MQWEANCTCIGLGFDLLTNTGYFEKNCMTIRSAIEYILKYEEKFELKDSFFKFKKENSIILANHYWGVCKSKKRITNLDKTELLCQHQ